MTERQEALLASIIREYVQTAQPISSKQIENSGFFELSSASIRAEMNELEERGYLAHLHTSGGRVPTDKAYRYFVDNLIDLESIRPMERDKRKIKEVIQRAENDPRELIKTVGQVLSSLSENLVITNIEDDPLKNDGSEFFKTGLSSLFELPEFREFERIFRVTNFFDEFERFFGRIEQELFNRTAEDIKIMIGQESNMKEIKDETVIYATYQLPHGFRGMVALIGPTRMNYQRNIGLLKYTGEEIDKLN